MIIVQKEEEIIYIPINQRCKIDKCNIYQLIIYDRYEKCTLVYKLQNISFDPIRFAFKIILPDYFTDGHEYTYYLVNTNEWTPKDINKNYVTNTRRTTDKQAISKDGLYIISNGKMLVTSFFKAKLMQEDEKIKEGEYVVLVNDKSKDMRAYGDIVDSLSILDIGIMKYIKPSPAICKDHCKYTSGHNEYVSYKKCNNG